jgi:hypothetical protein
MNTEQAKESKRSYRKPQLVEYGDIHDITQGVGTNGAVDGGGGQPNTAI